MSLYDDILKGSSKFDFNVPLICCLITIKNYSCGTITASELSKYGFKLNPFIKNSSPLSVAVSQFV